MNKHINSARFQSQSRRERAIYLDSDQKVVVYLDSSKSDAEIFMTDQIFRDSDSKYWTWNLLSNTQAQNREYFMQRCLK